MSRVAANSIPIDDVGHEDAARRLLGENCQGIDLWIQSINPFGDIKESAFVRARIDVDFLVILLRHQEVCRGVVSSGQSHLTAPILWAAHRPGHMRRHLVINETEFWFQGNPIFQGVTSSQKISIGYLAKWLAGPVVGDCSATGVFGDQFRWLGDCLLYAENELDRFTENILKNFPEVAAKELESKMKKQITGAVVDVSAPGSSTPAPRRKRTAL